MNELELREMLRNLAKLESGEGYVIIRAQELRESGIRISNGKLERISSSSNHGLGVQAFTPAGACGFAAADVISAEAGRDLVRRSLALAQRNEGISGVEKNRRIWEAPVLQDSVPSPAALNFGEIPIVKLQDYLLQVHDSLRQLRVEIMWQTSYREVEDRWWIARSDGTLVDFVIPRAVIMHQGTVRVNERAQSFLVHRSGMDAGVLLAEVKDRELERRAADRSDFARVVCQAEGLPNGNYPLVIDYGLAKGLAHEAFGHAVESDHMQESVLGENGKLRTGLQVARPGVHIIDGPLVGDWAYQPYSANALRRETVHIVRDGVLEQGLGDIFSAEDAGMVVSGAGRAESYAHVPLPRMSNIRLEVEKALPLEERGSYLEQAQEIRETLLRHGEMPEKCLLLLGYRGGQVNPMTGDFVFQCDGLMDLTDPQLRVYQPSIFSGKILSALQAIRLGLGTQHYDAIGTCGKNGQAVPSSGGSHSYILLDADDHVTLGGRMT